MPIYFEAAHGKKRLFSCPGEGNKSVWKGKKMPVKKTFRFIMKGLSFVCLGGILYTLFCMKGI
jgi:hypothetical protein